MIVTAYETITSPLTGREIVVNPDPENHLLPPTWTTGGVKAALAKFTPLWSKWQATLRNGGRTKATTRLLHSANRLATQTPEAFAGTFAAFMADMQSSSFLKVAGGRPLLHLRLALWAEGCLCFPRAGELSNVFHKDLNDTYLAHLRSLPLVAQMQDHLGSWGREAKWLLNALVTTQGVQSYADLTPDTLWIPEVRKERGEHSRMLRAVLAFQGEEGHWRYGPLDFRQVRRDRLGQVSQRDATLAPWVQEAEAWLAQAARPDTARVAVGRFLAYLAAHPQISRNPVAYLARSCVPSPLFKVDVDADRQIIKLLDHLLTRHCTVEDENGLPYIDPMFANPLTAIPSPAVRAAETHRQPMPKRLLDACVALLSDGDFTWARTVEPDYFCWLNPATGHHERVWSPVRAIALMTKMLTPARTAQVRWLDSGEADSLVYDPETGWQPNTGPLAPPQARRPMDRGVFRRYRRMDGTEGALLYFNTNKTRKAQSGADYGYVMPWENREVIALLAQLRDWQVKHYPLPTPVPWMEIREARKVFPRDRLRAMGSACFLFRDPCNEGVGRWRPVTDGRVRVLWLVLQAEVERRLRASNENVQLVKTWDSSGTKPKPAVAVFDLHTLRVTMISALYKQGVPAEVLMKVVGHASVLMTLYYVKFSPEEITQQIDAAQLAIQREMQDSWIEALRERLPEALSRAMAHSHPSAVDAFAKVNRAGLVVMDHGLCPVGAGRCDEGLATETERRIPTYGPVPGGAANCARCRFFITGIPFLIGLAAHVDDLAYRARRLSIDYAAAKDRLATLQNDQMRAGERGEAFARWHDLRLASTGLDVATTTLDDALLSMADAIQLAKQCEELARREAGDGYSLVAAGGTGEIEVVLREAHEVEQLQRICTNATLFDGLRIDWREANLRRGRYFDRILRDTGREPVFVHLDEATVKRVGDELGRLLYKRLGHDNVAALAEGQTTLRRLGVEQAVLGKLDDMVPKVLRGLPALLEGEGGRDGR